MELTDYSALRAAPGTRIRIPLNGVHYFAEADVPADLILDAVLDDAASAVRDLPEGMSMEELAEANPGLAGKLSAAGSSSFTKALAFMREVLEPDSWEQWEANMRRPEKGLTPKKRQEHQARYITVAQLLAVFKDLVRHYCGRPTGPSSSSQNGDGGTGGTSTGGAPPEA